MRRLREELAMAYVGLGFIRQRHAHEGDAVLGTFMRLSSVLFALAALSE